jgi:DNA-directed RNA polymerase subunit N (RpoN/RPB10)
MIDYRCFNCGAINCKLWRQYQTFLNHITLLCAVCAARDQGESITDIDSDGKRTIGIPMHRSDQIGIYIPAVPTKEWDTFWGYTSVPQEGCTWWRYLPTLRAEP